MEGKTITAWFVELGGDPSQINELYRRKDQIYFPLLRERGIPRPGLVKLLEELGDAGVTCALATSARRVNMDLMLDLFDLRRFFPVTLGLEDVTHVKPHPEVFLRALERLCAKPSRCVVLEDAPKGVRAAIGAGIPVVGVPTPWTRNSCFDGVVLLVDSIEDLSAARLIALLAPNQQTESL